MGVKVRALTMVGGPPVVRAFEDDFNRADTALGLGDAYVSSSQGLPLSGAAAFMIAEISSNLCRFRREPIAAAGTPSRVMMWPWAVLSSLWGRPQFAELTIVASAAGVNRCGAGVMMTPDMRYNTENGYAFVSVIESNAFIVQRITPTLTDLVTGLALALGDVLRIEATPGSAANGLTIFNNGVAVATFSDSNAARVMGTGAPALFGGFCDQNLTQDWDDFSCGAT